jgi:hypothetical protein
VFLAALYLTYMLLIKFWLGAPGQTKAGEVT